MVPALALDFGESFAQAWDESTDSQWFNTIATGQQWPAARSSTAGETLASQHTAPSTLVAPILDMDDQMQIDMEAAVRASQASPVHRIPRKPVPSRSAPTSNTRPLPQQVSPRQRSQRHERHVTISSRTPSIINNSRYKIQRPAPRSPPQGTRRSTRLQEGLWEPRNYR